MPTYNAYAVSGIAPPSLRRRRRGVSSHPVLALGAQFPTGPSTTVGPTGARLRVRCLSARGSSGAPSETADFERSNGTGFGAEARSELAAEGSAGPVGEEPGDRLDERDDAWCAGEAWI